MGGKGTDSGNAMRRKEQTEGMDDPMWVGTPSEARDLKGAKAFLIPIYL